VNVEQDEDALLPISGLQHIVFCERQCALIHVEREWEENQPTAEGRTLHERVDEGYKEYRRGLKQFSGVSVRSSELGLFGRLDVLEVVKTSDAPDNVGFLGLRGNWSLHPVEFKRGKPKEHEADRVQVCAQALCLEEMTGTRIESASIFYGKIRRRSEVALTDELRARTATAVGRFREMVLNRELPLPVYRRHCRSCSLLAICQPQHTNGATVDAYKKELFG